MYFDILRSCKHNDVHCFPTRKRGYQCILFTFMWDIDVFGLHKRLWENQCILVCLRKRRISMYFDLLT